MRPKALLQARLDRYCMREKQGVSSYTDQGRAHVDLTKQLWGRSHVVGKAVSAWHEQDKKVARKGRRVELICVRKTQWVDRMTS
eukprot:6206407-Pleurochrysis_carterae.AAC.3